MSSLSPTTRRARRVEAHGPIRTGQPDDRRQLVRPDGLGERACGQRRVGVEVDLVAIEVEQLGVDRSGTGLPGGLDDQASDRLPLVDDDRAVAADQPRGVEVLGVLDLGDDVGRGVGTLVGQREEGLDDLGVRLVTVRRQHDDRPGLAGVAEGQVAEVER